MSNIYELPKEIDQALLKYYNCFDEETGELIVEEEMFKKAEKDLFELQNQKDELLEWYLKDRSNRLSDNAGLQNEINRLQLRIKTNNKKIERVEKIVDYNFAEMFNGKAINFGSFTVNYKNSEATVIEDESMIPDKYKVTETKVTIKIPKAEIKKALKSGEKVPGAIIQKNKTLSIK